MADNIVSLPAPSPPRLLPLVLASREPDAELLADASEAIRARVASRDLHTCRFCGIPARGHTRCVRIDDARDLDNGENLATACSFCSACHQVGQPGQPDAELIWLPEMSQPELNLAVRSCHTVRIWSESFNRGGSVPRPEVRDCAKSMGREAESLARGFAERARACISLIGTSAPMVVAQACRDPSVDRDTLRALSGEGVRLLPRWRLAPGECDVQEHLAMIGPGGAYANLNPRTWMSVFRESIFRERGQ